MLFGHAADFMQRQWKQLQAKQNITVVVKDLKMCHRQHMSWRKGSDQKYLCLFIPELFYDFMIRYTGNVYVQYFHDFQGDPSKTERKAGK